MAITNPTVRCPWNPLATTGSEIRYDNTYVYKRDAVLWTGSSFVMMEASGSVVPPSVLPDIQIVVGTEEDSNRRPNNEPAVNVGTQVVAVETSESALSATVAAHPGGTSEDIQNDDDDDTTFTRGNISQTSSKTWKT